MDVVHIRLEDRKAVEITYDTGRKVRYVYNHLISENPDLRPQGWQLRLEERKEEIHVRSQAGH